MDSYSSVDDGQKRDELFYRTPVFGPEDIICPGSDSEETSEQTRQRRLRYERQARRYLRGHRHVLLSASLRGPFSRESGWTNPWNHPQTDELQGGSRQGPRDTVSARIGLHKSPSFDTHHATALARGGKRDSSMREKTERADGLSVKPQFVEKEFPNKLSYVNSAEVLAWQVEIDGTKPIIREEVPSGRDWMKEYAYGDETMVMAKGTLNARNLTKSKAKPVDSILNHHAKTPSTNGESDTARGAKRARDSQWLIGSYVSKRARWNGPALSSPTPRPDSHTSKDRMRRSVGSRQQEPRAQPRMFDPGSMSNQSPQTNTLSSTQVEDRRILDLITPFTGSGLSKKISTRQTKFGHEMNDSQEHVPDVKSLSRKSSGKTLLRSSSGLRSCSPPHAEQHDLNAISHLADAPESANAHGSSVQAATPGNTLPQFPRPRSHSTELDEDSFVSDVAPSSRNLEKFHFKIKKRKRRIQPAQHSKSSYEGLQPSVVKYPHHESSPIKCEAQPPSITPEPTHSVCIQHQDDSDAELSKDQEINEESTFKFPKDTLNLEGPNQDDIPRNMVDIEVEEHHADEKDQSTEALNLLPQAPEDTSELLNAHVLFPVDGHLPIDNEDGGSSNIGDMSFLRAVMRAGDPACEMQFSQSDEISESKQSLVASDKDYEGDHPLPPPEAFNFGTSKHVPSSLKRKSASVRLSSPEVTPSKNYTDVRKKSQNHVQSSRGQISPPKRGYSSPVLPKLNGSQMEYNQFVPIENDTIRSDLPPASTTKTSEGYASSCSHQMLPEKHVLSTSVEPFQDPNDFSALSYNNTPFKSQRSARCPQFPRNSPLGEDLDGCEDERLPEVGEIVMDRIQLQLSQICSSSDEAASPSEEDDVDVAQSPAKPKIQANEAPSSTDAIEPASCQASGTQEERSEEAPGTFGSKKARELGPETEKLEVSLDHPPIEHVVEHDLHVEANNVDYNQVDDLDQLDDEAKQASEASWEGCGPQSPWAIEFVEPILTSVPAIEDNVEVDAIVLSQSRNMISLDENRAAEQSENSDASSEWIHIELPRTPLKFANEPFEELPPNESSKAREVATTEGLTNTQILNAATNNPWTASLEKSSAVKATKKRVSFGKSSSESQDGEDSKLIVVKFEPASQSIQEHDDENDTFYGVKTKTLISRKSPSRRQFKQILPEKASSPAHSSPAVIGQAEAFIAADRKSLIEQEPSTTSTPSKHLKIRSEMDSNLVWMHPDETNMLLTSYMRIDRSPSPPASTPFPGFEDFDMEEALGEAGKFLEDWSVDSELKRAKKSSDTNTGNESNGYRRRRLFGLV